MILVPQPVTVRLVGGDYAWAHPDPAALQASGFKFAARYLSPDATKNLTLAEAELLAAHGISCVANFESTATEAENGYDAGVADAKLALVQATAAGMPSGRPIYFSVDENTVVGPHITGYFQGVQSVLGKEATGGYGDFVVVRALLDAGLITWAWETTAWSGDPTQWDPRVHIRQVQNGLVIGGAQVDLDHGMADDIGQWTPGDEFVMDAQAVAAFQKVNDQLTFLTEAIGKREDTVDAADAAMEAKLAQIATGITDSYNQLAAKLDKVPAAVTAAVVAELPTGTQVDAAALEAAVTAAMREVLTGATVTGTIAPAAEPQAQQAAVPVAA